MNIGKAILLVTGGFVAGATVALLFAPAKGKDARKNITKTARKMKDDLADKVEESSKAVSGIKNHMKDFASQIKKTIAT